MKMAKFWEFLLVNSLLKLCVKRWYQ
jgi:hypothetical protein